MRRTYFIPMVVLGALLLLCGIASVAMVVVVQPRLHSLQEKSWEGDFKNGSDYRLLHDAGLALLQKGHQEKKDHTAFAGASGIAIGGLLIWWALDRRRLLAKVHTEPRDTTSAQPQDRSGAATPSEGDASDSE